MNTRFSEWLQIAFKKKEEKLHTPYFLHNSEFVGGLNEAKEFISSKLKRTADCADLVDGFEKIEVKAEPILNSQGIISGTLDVVEGLLSSLNPVSWFSGSSVESKPTSDVPQFELLMTNWYFRQQLRIFRFYPKAFCRIHPRTGDVRASRPYTDFLLVEVLDTVNLIFQYHNSSPDYLSGSPSDIKAIQAFLSKQNIQIKEH